MAIRKQEKKQFFNNQQQQQNNVEFIKDLKQEDRPFVSSNSD